LETNETHKLTDKAGNIYTLYVYSDDGGFEGRLFWKKYGVGYINCILQPNNQLLIGDIVLHDEPVGKRGCLPTARIWHKVPQYKHVGLGSKMLKFIVDRAVSMKADSIYGFIVPNDLKYSPHLIDWYRHHGFTLIEGDNNNLPYIYLTLRSRPHSGNSKRNLHSNS